MIPVQSSNIAAIDHDPVLLELTVEFKNGTRYLYRQVPPSIFDQLIKADSVGSAFHKLIKSHPGNFPAAKLPTIIG